MRYWINREYGALAISEKKPKPLIFKHRYHGEQKREWVEISKEQYNEYYAKAFNEEE